jgi:hypothetical protein
VLPCAAVPYGSACDGGSGRRSVCPALLVRVAGASRAVQNYFLTLTLIPQ